MAALAGECGNEALLLAEEEEEEEEEEVVGEGIERPDDDAGLEVDDIDVALGRGADLGLGAVLTDVLSFVPDRWLLSCALVCSAWREVIASQTFWKTRCLRSRRFVERSMAPHYPADWKEFYRRSPYSRNLIRNPSGKEGFDGWELTSNGGDRWLVETEHAGSGEKPAELLALSDGSPHQFATSYGWCKRYQDIDLLREGFSESMLDEGQPDILVSEWYAPRFDCGNVYQLKVILLRDLSREPSAVINEFVFGPLTTPQWACKDWKQVSHIFSRYGPGLRFIKFKDKSKDTQFWAGHYGSKMAGAVVRAQFD